MRVTSLAWMAAGIILGSVASWAVLYDRETTRGEVELREVRNDLLRTAGSTVVAAAEVNNATGFRGLIRDSVVLLSVARDLSKNPSLGDGRVVDEINRTINLFEDVIGISVYSLPTKEHSSIISGIGVELRNGSHPKDAQLDALEIAVNRTLRNSVDLHEVVVGESSIELSFVGPIPALRCCLWVTEVCTGEETGEATCFSLNPSGLSDSPPLAVSRVDDQTLRIERERLALRPLLIVTVSSAIAGREIFDRCKLDYSTGSSCDDPTGDIFGVRDSAA